MDYLVTYLKPFLRKGDEGQDLLEYALLVALIAIGSILAVTPAGNNVKEIFTDVSTGI